MPAAVKVAAISSCLAVLTSSCGAMLAIGAVLAPGTALATGTAGDAAGDCADTPPPTMARENAAPANPAPAQRER